MTFTMILDEYIKFRKNRKVQSQWNAESVTYTALLIIGAILIIVPSIFLTEKYSLYKLFSLGIGGVLILGTVVFFRHMRCRKTLAEKIQNRTKYNNDLLEVLGRCDVKLEDNEKLEKLISYAKDLRARYTSLSLIKDMSVVGAPIFSALISQLLDPKQYGIKGAVIIAIVFFVVGFAFVMFGKIFRELFFYEEKWIDSFVYDLENLTLFPNHKSDNKAKKSGDNTRNHDILPIE